MSLISLDYFVTVYAQNFAPKPPIVGMLGDIICSYTSLRVSLATVVRVRPARRCRIVFGRAKSLKCQVETIAIRVSAAPGLYMNGIKDRLAGHATQARGRAGTDRSAA